jgi:hypothetical protein
MSVESWRKEYGNLGSCFNLQKWEEKWYEQVIPEENIPEQFQGEARLPGGRTQIIDLRVPGWTFRPDYENKDGSLGAMVVCPEAAADELNP